MRSTKNLLAGAAILALPSVLGCGGETRAGIDGGAPVDEPDATPAGPIEITEDITEDTSWEPGTYVVPQDFYVYAELSLAPCTTIMGQNRIHVAQGGSIEAVGKQDCPIVFTSSNDTPAAGDWRSVHIRDTAENGNVFEHAVFEYGGNDLGIVRADAGVAFRNCEIRHVDGPGINHTGGPLAELSDMTFESISGHPARVQIDDVDVIDGVSTTDVQNDALFVQGSTLSEPATWSPQSIPYELYGSSTNFHIEAELTVEAGTTLTISTGDVRGFIQDGGSMQVEGTEQDPVVIETVKETPAAGEWRNLRFRDSAEASSFSWTTIRHGGSSTLGAAIYAEAAVSLDNVTFEDNDQCDVNDPDGLVTANETSYESC